jgi:putative redox protein
MQAIIRYLGGVRFEAEARGHTIISDQPVENGGEDVGMTPPELMLASLGTCAGYYAAQYLKIHNLPADDLTVCVNAEKALQPARLGTFRIEVESGAANDAKHREGLLRATKKCLIHNTLMTPPTIDITVHARETVNAG